MKEEWQNLGNDIRDMVQDAITYRDFKKLNQNIRNTINEALETAGIARKNSRSAGTDYRQNGAYTEYQYSSTQPEEKMSGSWDSKSRRTGGAYNSGGAYGGRTYGSSRTPAQRGLYLPAKTNATLAGGIALFVCGGFLAAGTGAAIVVLTILDFTLSEMLGFLVARGLLLPVFAVGIAMVVAGSRKCSLVNRFKSYVSRLRGRTYCEIKELAKLTGKSRAYVVKDLRKMIVRGWFPQGHLDDGKTCFIADDATYAQYRETLTWAEEQKREAEEERRTQEAEAEAAAGLSPEAVQTIQAGKEYIKRLRACNDAIPGEEMSEKILRMEVIVSKIFDRVERHPENVDDLRKMMEYYLPTTVKLLEAYEELDSQPVQGENIAGSKKEIEDTLDTLNEAFERLFDSMFQETAWDVSTDISVLKTLLAQEGLAEDKIKK